MEQIRRDSTFLERMGVMDYSLLVGIQEKDQTIAEESFVFRSNRKASILTSKGGVGLLANAARGSFLQALDEETPDEARQEDHNRVQASGGGSPRLGPPSPILVVTPTPPTTTTSTGNGSPRLETRSIKKPSMPKMFSQKQITTEFSERSADFDDDARSFVTAEGGDGIQTPHVTFDGVTSMLDSEAEEASHLVQQRQERLDSAEFNSFYKIDSVDELGETYHLGIIDIFTKYSTTKRTEHYLKSIVLDGNKISAVPPVSYKERFIKFIDDICR